MIKISERRFTASDDHIMGLFFCVWQLLDNPALSAAEIRRLVGWQALMLVDLLRRRCVTVRSAERARFNLEVVRRLERRRLKDCVEVVDWGMQLEDWEAHTPEQLPEACATIAQLAQRLLEQEPLGKGRAAAIKKRPSPTKAHEGARSKAKAGP
jgi:hypothetical protein